MPCSSQQFSIDDLGDLIFPSDKEVAGYFCMVIHTFLDDSEHRSAGLVVSAGFCATRDAWAYLRYDWRQALLKHGLKYFKSSECNHVDGEFRKLRKGKFVQPEEKEQAKLIRDDFLHVAEKHSRIKGVGVVIDTALYRRFASVPDAYEILPQDPYNAALSSIMLETTKRICRIARNPMVAFVHDEEDDFDKLRACYREFRQKNSNIAKKIGGFQPMDDEKTPELQLADLLANHTAFIASKSPSVREHLLEMKENLGFIAIWDEDYLKAVLEDGLARKGKPLPLTDEEPPK